MSGAAAVALSKGWHLEGKLLLLPAFVGVVMIATHLARVPVYGEDDYTLLRGRRFTPILVELTDKRRILEVLLDFFLIAGAYYAAYLIRFDSEFPEYYSLFVVSLPIVIACHLTNFFVVGVYRSVWRYVSIGDMMKDVRGIVLGLASSVVALLFAFRFEGYSRTLFIINGMVLLILVAASRMSFRMLRNFTTGARPGALRALIYGAGEGGVMLLRELKANTRSRPYYALAFLDDDPRKQGKTVDGLYVAGGSSDLEAVSERLEIDVVILSTGRSKGVAAGSRPATVRAARQGAAEVRVPAAAPPTPDRVSLGRLTRSGWCQGSVGGETTRVAPVWISAQPGN